MKRLTVLCPTYNHENYISAALDGFVMQKTNFEFEVIVADDASTDKTPEIIKNYAEKYPDLIKPVLREKNLGAVHNFQDIIQNITTDYVALCEGDDFWTDENKLQLQFDFLEEHPEFSICYHTVDLLYEDNPKKTGTNPSQDPLSPYCISPQSKNPFVDPVLTLKDIAQKASIPCCSVMYRWRFKNGKDLDLFRMDVDPRDYLNNLLHAEVGKAYFIDRVMGKYRRPVKSYWMEDNIYERHFFSIINFYAFAEDHFDKKIYELMKKEREFYLRSGFNYFFERKDTKNLAKLLTEQFDCFFEAERLLREDVLQSKMRDSIERNKRYAIRNFWLISILLMMSMGLFVFLVLNK